LSISRYQLVTRVFRKKLKCHSGRTGHPHRKRRLAFLFINPSRIVRRRRRGSGISPNQLGLKLGYGCTIDRSAEGREIIDVGRAQFSKTSSFYGAEGQLWIGGRSRGSSSLRRPRTRGLCAGLTRLPQLADNPEQTFAAIVTGATGSHIDREGANRRQNRT